MLKTLALSKNNTKLHERLATETGLSRLESDILPTELTLASRGHVVVIRAVYFEHVGASRLVDDSHFNNRCVLRSHDI